MLPEFGIVTGNWGDRPVIIVGAGPSLSGFDFNRLRGLGYVLAVKEMMFELPWADCCFALDLPWITRRYAQIEQSSMPIYLGADNRLPRKHPLFERGGVVYIEKLSGDGLYDSPVGINSCGTSGFGALNVAYHKRARTIFLFGFDYTVTPREGAIEQHHFDNAKYPWHNRSNRRYWGRWAEHYRYVLPQIEARGIEIINASPASAIEAFPKVSVDGALDRLQAMQ